MTCWTSNELVVGAGQAASQWAGDELAAFAQLLSRNPNAVLVTGDSAGFSAEFPHPDGTILLRALTTDPDRDIGEWPAYALDPAGAGPGRPGAWANDMNRRELSSMNRGHFLGSWVVTRDLATFVAFAPNMLAVRPGLIPNLIIP